MSIINIFTAPNNLTLKRPTGPTLYVKGTAQAIARGSVTFTGSVQPITGIELKNLPELQRARDPRWIFTKTQLKTVDVAAGTSADVVTYEGKDYIVTEVEELDDWNGGDLAHYQATVLKKDKT